MDLVDIDQVLDNLELREAADEHVKATDSRVELLLPKRATSAESATTRNGEPEHAATVSPTTHTPSGPHSASVPNNYSKSFVGVSQVFNSLDDYRKDVETLESAPIRRYDDECKLITNETEATDSAQAAGVQCVQAAALEPEEKCTRDTKCTKNEELQDGRDGTDERDRSESDVDDVSNDIDKYTERSAGQRYDDKDFDDLTGTNTSDSLTTSSSSTFSSGPSPGLASTTEDRSTPLSGGEYDEEYVVEASGHSQATKPQTQSVQETAQETEQHSSAVVDVVRREECNQPSEVFSHQTEGLEDLAVGLSSISINSQTDLRRGITVSSALGGLLNDLSATATSCPHSPAKDSECHRHRTDIGEEDESSLRVTPSLSLIECESMKKQERHPKGDKPVNVASKTRREVPNTPPLQHPKMQQHPITFGSTMDEISDTELDSMLQEMDIDDECNRDPAEVLNTDKTHTHLETAACRRALDERVGGEVGDVGDVVDVVANADQMNADSFSQASTVEFSEIRAQQQQQLLASNELSQSLNSISSSYSSSDSSMEDEIQLSGGRRTTSNEPSSRRPKRPTTLDLPAMKINLYANAGQTPPGTSFAAPGDMEPEDSASTEESLNSKDSTEAAGVEPSQTGVSNEGGLVEEEGVAVKDVNRKAEQGRTAAGPSPFEAVEDGDGDGDGDTMEATVAPAEIAEATGYSDPHANLGKTPPIWVPDNMATACMQCFLKFTMIKRRHHCRACGKVLCSVCCSQKFKLDFLANPESRVCVQCFLILSQRQQADGSGNCSSTAPEDDSAAPLANPESTTNTANAPAVAPVRSPNPNNPMEYCSTIPPYRQVSNSKAANPPSVIVPVGVLKKDCSNSSNSSNSSNKKARKRKSVMFSDGIAPGSDLACLENQWSEAKHARRHQQNEKPRVKQAPSAAARTETAADASAMGLVAQLFRGSIPPAAAAATVTVAHSALSGGAKPNAEDKASTPKAQIGSKTSAVPSRSRHLPPSGCDEYGCFIPKEELSLPPIILTKGDNSCELEYKEVSNDGELVERLQRETLKFAVQKNFFVYVKIVTLKCCLNKTVINFTTSGMHQVGNDEILILLEYTLPTNKSDVMESPIPKDIFVHLNEIYMEAQKCRPIGDLSFTMPQQSTFLGSREYGGFLYIRATFQCLQDVVMPENPFLIGVLIQRNEVPWAKVFPLRLMLRLGAQSRYYPCPHVSVRNREAVYAEIAQTIINFLADFRNYTYTLPCIKGMYIHMEDRLTSVLIPRNRYDEVIKAMNNSSDHILAFGGNFSKAADGHLVCIQNTNDESAEMYSYSTQAINIQGQPRKVTGASFFVLNEALKSSSGLSGKCSIVEDGLMVQILPAKMDEVRNALKNSKDIDIVCGPLNADEQQTEVVSIKWVENDRDFGTGVKSPIDSMSLEGISGMRVHASFNYSNANYSIRLTEIYMIKCDDWSNRIHSLDVTRISEQIARSASVALLPFLDLLSASGSSKIGLRVTLHQENVCYEAGSRSTKLPPLYMNALDNHLIPTLHKESTGIEDAVILELIFYILNA